VKRLATAIAIAGIIGTPAFAADIATKAPAPAPAPVYNWTGWYVGVNAGASMGKVDTDFNVAPVTVTLNANPGHGLTNPFDTPGFGGSNPESPAGFMGGGQIGYNYQFSPIWVVGFEADFQGALERDHTTLTDNFSLSGLTSPVAVSGTVVRDYQTKIDWFGTVRLRAGYVWGNGNVFSYVTGGLAYGKVDLDGTSTTSGTISGVQTAGGGPLTFSTTRAIGHSNVNTGWTLGYGTEGVIDFWGARNWTWRVETLYMDFGHVHDTDPPPAQCDEGNCFITHVTGGQTTTNTHFTDWILRGGLSYQFH
jgi:outer membrane immunogenic protein